MRKLICLTALAAVAVTAFAAPSVASAADQARFGSSLVVAIPVAPAQGMRPAVETAYTGWSGRITAKSSTCAYKRLITIWEVRSGADQKLDTTLYHWNFKKVGYLAKTGRTYAKMAATSQCAAQESGKFFVRLNGGSR